MTSKFKFTFVQLVDHHLLDLTFYYLCSTEESPCLSEAGEIGTKPLYKQEPDPVIYIVLFLRFLRFWAGCLSSLLETTKPSLLL